MAKLPGTPTLAEVGLDGYVVSNRLDFVAPPGMPAALVATLNAAFG